MTALIDKNLGASLQPQCNILPFYNGATLDSIFDYDKKDRVFFINTTAVASSDFINLSIKHGIVTHAVKSS